MMIFQFLFSMTSAPITPGTQPHNVNKNTITTDPHPRSITASGGKKMARRTRRRDIGVIFLGFPMPDKADRDKKWVCHRSGCHSVFG